MLLKLTLLTLCATVIATLLMTRWLKRRLVLDLPNDRSNHAAPTPRGAGLAVTLCIAAGTAAAVLLLPLPMADGVLTVLAASIALSVVSFFDDRHGLPVYERLLAQLLAVGVGLSALPSFVGDALPTGAWLALAGLAWLWCLNAVNFMDGIDGITGVESGSIALGVVVLGALYAPMPEGASMLAASLLGGAAGFLVWNWHPARVFMGDAGSVAIGYLLGYLLLALAASGAWAQALILPAYYMADAGFTLARRVLRGEKPWEAHSEHAYQRAVRAGCGHDWVSLRIAALNSVLVMIAFGVTLELLPAWLGIAAAYALAFAMMRVCYSPRGCALA